MVEKLANHNANELELEGRLKRVQLSGNFDNAKSEVLSLMDKYIDGLYDNISGRLTQKD